MEQSKSIILGTNERHLEILKGFYQVTDFFRKLGVHESTIQTMIELTKQTYYKYDSFSFKFQVENGKVLNIDNHKIYLFSNGMAGTNDPSMNYEDLVSQNFSQNGFDFNGFTSMLQTSDDPTMAAIGTGLEILDGLGLDFQQNINNVLQYGLDSWGASTTPLQSKTKFTNEAMPYVNDLLGNINDQNFQNTINEVEKYLSFIIALETHKLKDHTNAKSTQLGRESIIKMATELKEDTVNKIIVELQSNGIYVEKYYAQETNNQIRYKWSSTDNSLHHDGPFKYIQYRLTKQNVKGNLYDNNKNNTAGNVAAIAGVGLLAWIIIPKIIK